MIWLSTPHFNSDDLEVLGKKLQEVNYLHDAAHVSRFEEKLSAYFGKRSLCLNSGTSAIHVALRLLNISEGDEVLCSDFSFAATAFPAQYEKARLTFIDCEKENWGMDPNALEDCLLQRRKFGKLPKAIIIAHCYGMPYKIDELHSIADRYGVPVIEDAAEAMGSSFKGRLCGSFGALSALSFNLNKIITTCGGGSLQTSSEKDFLKARKMVNQSKEANVYYKHDETGFNYRMNSLGAALGLSQFDHLSERIEKKRKIHRRYMSELSDLDGVDVFSESSDDYKSNHWLTCITYKHDIDIIQMCARLKSLDIEVRPLWKPLHHQKAFSSSEFYGSGHSDVLFARGLCLPSSTNLTDDNQSDVVKAIKASL